MASVATATALAAGLANLATSVGVLGAAVVALGASLGVVVDAVNDVATRTKELVDIIKDAQTENKGDDKESNKGGKVLLLEDAPPAALAMVPSEGQTSTL